MPTEKTEWRPVVGDRVRVKSVPNPDWVMQVGYEFTVARIVGNEVMDSRDAVCNYIFAHCLEPAPAEQAEFAACGYRVVDRNETGSLIERVSDGYMRYVKEGEDYTNRTFHRPDYVLGVRGYKQGSGESFDYVPRATKTPTPQHADCKACGGRGCADDKGCLSCGANAVATAAAAGLKEGPYEKHRKVEQVRDLSQWYGGKKQTEARARLIAALASELAKSVTPRFPAEGRQDRALPYSNGRK